MTSMIFDIETIPDYITAEKIYSLSGLTPKEIMSFMLEKTQEKNPNAKMVPLHLHKIVAISVVVRADEWVKVWSLGEEISTEKEILERFFSGIEKYQPTLISWNGKGYDCPVIHYRSLYNKVASPLYWEQGETNSQYKWNNYLNRYHTRHLDLMDFISCFQANARAPLNEISLMLGLPGKMGIDGSQVSEYFLENKLDLIRNYCETDVLNTYLVYLNFQLIRGIISHNQFDKECELLKEYLEKQTEDHLNNFLIEWNNG